MQPNEPLAAPPDDGGHRGSMTTPDEEMQIRDADAPPMHAPDLNTDVTGRAGEASRGVSGGPVVLLILASLGIVALLMYLYAWPM